MSRFIFQCGVMIGLLFSCRFTANHLEKKNLKVRAENERKLRDSLDLPDRILIIYVDKEEKINRFTFFELNSLKKMKEESLDVAKEKTQLFAKHHNKSHKDTIIPRKEFLIEPDKILPETVKIPKPKIRIVRVPLIGIPDSI